ncbi:MAG: hypothetical protein JNM18_11255 [Planctomycetaceae bacterium]|nr:hypothetical protein [Planctomycetaceae bacterium]
MANAFPDDPALGHEKPPAEKPLSGLYLSEPGNLEPAELESLWEVFLQIGRTWSNVVNDSAGQRSSWLEFVQLRCLQEPSYLKTYRNALSVVRETVDQKGLVDAYRFLLVNPELSKETKEAKDIDTALKHAKFYVINEFIRVQIVAGGFRGFGGRNHAYNYNGFLRGTRYNRVQRVRTYRPAKDGRTK